LFDDHVKGGIKSEQSSVRRSLRLFIIKKQEKNDDFILAFLYLFLVFFGLLPHLNHWLD